MKASLVDQIAASYEAVPYRHGAVTATHPARLGAIARLHGISAAAPDHCRVLELGCGECLNLLPLAERLSRSEFVGVDLSPGAISRGEAIRSECRITNARLICGDLRDWEPDGEFDYVIAHGVYSWVPGEVRERLLAMAAKALAPGGVAYVSYNTLPGWSLPGGIRAFLQNEIGTIRNAGAQLTHTRGVLSALSAALADLPGAYSAHLRLTVADMLAKPPELFFHDELELANDPCTFTEFVGHASGYGLHYLAEAHYATMPFEHLPLAAREALAGLDLDFVRQQQFMDVLFQRWTRNSLLCQTPLPASRPIFPESIQGCAVGSRLQLPDEPIDFGADSALHASTPTGLELTTHDAWEKAVLATLAEFAPNRVPFTEVILGANRRLEGAGLQPINNQTAVCAYLYRLFALDAVDLLLAGDGDGLRLGEHPAPSPLMRHEARLGLPVTNRWHEPITLTPDGARWVAEFSGEANPDAFKAGLLV